VADEFIDPSRIEAAKETAHAEEGLVAVLTGAVGWVASGLAVTMSLLFMYSARATVTTQILRLVFPRLFPRVGLSPLSHKTEGWIHRCLMVPIGCSSR
jgi:hypothetical protein